MIIGVGIDIVECDRLKKSLERFGKSFLDHYCTDLEQSQAPTPSAQQVTYYAGRWAAKEACCKALGTGIGEDCAWKDMQVENIPGGQPRITLSGDALKTAERLGITTLHLSISHEMHYATACVIAEKN